MTRGKLSAIIAPVVVVCAYIIQASVPHNVVTLPKQSLVSPGIHATSPQGWAFFTKSPRSLEIYPYKLSPDGGVESLRSAPISSPKYAFGWNRLGRAQGVEQAILTNQIPPGAWHSCDTEVSDCVGYPDQFDLRNDSPNPSVCGRVAFATESPAPWAWRDLIASTWQVQSVSVGVVECR